MNYVTGKTIRMLREARGMTQKELAEKLCLSDKTISKWETDRGLPDIGILSELSAALGVSIAELLTGEVVRNKNRSANMKRGKFYICPICGNVLYAMGEGTYSCCGVTLPPLDVEEGDAQHELKASIVDGDLYIQIDHPMEKTHYITFIAYVTDDCVQMKKLYPEQNAEATFRRGGWGKVYACCNRHGLFEIKYP